MIGRPPLHGAAAGGKVSRLYRIWSGMKCRCHTSTSMHYPRYGARGIVVCERWRNSFVCFERWALEHGYSDTLQIDRIDNSCGYTPDNCRWVTPLINCANRRRSIILPTGETTFEAAKRLGVTPQAIRYRLKIGMSPSEVADLAKIPNGGMRKYFRKHHSGKWDDSK